MTMANRLKALPPLPEDGDPEATLRAVQARNDLLAEALKNMCEAWRMLRGETLPEMDEVLKACRIPEAA